MKRFVLDASVAIKWFVPEVHSVAAIRLLDEAVHLSAPDLIAPEIGSALWKKIRRGEITPEEGSEIIEAFATIPVEVYSSAELLEAAMALAIELDRSVYDSLYLALAVAQNCELVTADRRFHSVVSGSSLASQIRWIEDEL
jgi:predicted nucleic acid-binding protein